MKKLLIAGLLIFPLIGCAKQSEAEILAKETEAAAVDVAAAEEANPDNVQAAPNSWEYDESKDEMRGINTKFAHLLSENYVDFDFPYDGGSQLKITLRKKTNEPSEVILVISKGQYSCDTISDNCYTSLKFDNKPIEQFALDGTTDHSSDVLFIKYPHDINRFINSLKTSKNLIIELPFYQAGNKQFKFSLSQLNWATPKANKSAALNEPATDVNVQAAIDAAADATAAAEDAQIAIDAETAE